MESKNSKRVKLFLLLLIIPTSLLAQDKPVYDLIGEKISKVAATYGKPTYPIKLLPKWNAFFTNPKPTGWFLSAIKKEFIKLKCAQL